MQDAIALHLYLNRLTSADARCMLAGALKDARMELTWINKLRIAGVGALGVALIGLLAWPLAAPNDPLLPVRAWSIGFLGTITLLAMAFWIGFAGYFIAWPHGREIGILGVPLGLAVWAGRSGPMSTLMQAISEPSQRQALLQSLRFEPFYWLLLVAAGFAGVLVAQRLRPGSRPLPSLSQLKAAFKPGNYVNVGIALVVSTLVTAFLIGAFAQDLCTSHTMVAAQPAVGQVLFAAAGAFAAAAFVAKKFLDLGYIWPALASVFVFPFAHLVYGGGQTVARFAETQPATFYPHAIFAVVPVQLVALGALGSVLGYWLAVRYDYWRKHESA
jgi:hypothetical protein